MVERRRGLRLRQEASTELRRDRRFRTGDLERHFAAKGRIERQEHDSESTASKLAQDLEPTDSNRRGVAGGQDSGSCGQKR